MAKFPWLSSRILAWLHARSRKPARADLAPSPANPSPAHGCEQRWLAQVRDALRAISSISGWSDFEPIRSLGKPADAAATLANELISLMAQSATAEARVAGLAGELCEVTAEIEARIRSHRYEFELSELLRHAAAARSLAHSARIRISDQKQKLPDPVGRLLWH